MATDPVDVITDKLVSPKKASVLTPAQKKQIAVAQAKLAVLTSAPKPAPVVAPNGVGMGGGPTDPRSYAPGGLGGGANDPRSYSDYASGVLAPGGSITPDYGSIGGAAVPGQTSATRQSAGKGGGVAGHNGPNAPSGPNTDDLINQLYNTLKTEIESQGKATAGEYDAANTAITNQYTKAQEDLKNKYIATNNPLAANAANLGIDYGNSSINAFQDAALKRLEEQADLPSLASNQSYLEKMKVLNQGNFSNLLIGTETDRLAALQAAKLFKQGKGGGGSGGRGGGGGGSSTAGGLGKITQDASENMDIYNVGDRAALDALIASNPEAGYYAEAKYIENGLDPDATAAAIQKDIDSFTEEYEPSAKDYRKSKAAAQFRRGAYSNKPDAQAKQAFQTLASLVRSQKAKTRNAAGRKLQATGRAALPSILSFGGKLGNVKTQQQTNQKSTNTIPKPR